MSDDFAALVGSSTGPPVPARHEVNRPMIDHWTDAMGDANSTYRTRDAALAAGLSGIVAPPTMLQAWTMRGLVPSAGESGAHDRMMALLDEEGLTSVVATDCEQTYVRPLVIGDQITCTSVIESISDVKRTALGEGRFVTTRTDFIVGDDEPVATMRFRILKYRPARAPRPLRPRPAITEDNAYFFEGTKRHVLLIQRCVGCGALRHPPLPACPSCRSFEWDTVEASGRGTIFSFVVVHYPEVPAFDYPLPIGLVELEEGTRLVANLEGLDPSEWAVGMDVMVAFVDHDHDLTLPVFRPVDGS